MASAFCPLLNVSSLTGSARFELSIGRDPTRLEAFANASVPFDERTLRVGVIAQLAIFGQTCAGQESRSDANEVLVVTVPNVSRPVDEESFAQNIGLALRDARRIRHMRRRHLADQSLSAAQLKAAERGELKLSRPLLTELSSRYGVDLGALFSERKPLRVDDDVICIGDDSEPCDADALKSVLKAYLNLLDRVRADNTGAPGQPRPLRRDDIRVLAAHLNVPCPVVISELAELMDAKTTETRAMVELYLSGASVVGLRSSRAS